MSVLTELNAALGVRLTHVQTALRARLVYLRGDRGDSPVPTAVIIFGLVTVALAVTAAALTAANNWMGRIPGPPAP
ncbi:MULTISPECIES: hypothetical protein [unclassified Micromonospora]|uniref:hypothetical protein n=1 Tax=unclassified Micromonospora TaxID=2617518 RepID=UPI001034781B|nr:MULTISPECIES: hypothetical protein [unclassified Micromonospora]QKW11526.1 hypothetical protein HUT12_01125 [Verrucosispora sp. NA02020]QKW11650.1 hypothetical protein HUT12_01830 [Verrucosispora sp. NA02020]TBL31845.1 hypothetical protein EYA84_20530 [Verrucosispora sp. SN26_14.1]